MVRQGASITTDFGTSFDTIDLTEWTVLCEAIDELVSTDAPLFPYKKWLEPVSRYSFRAGHVIATLARRGS